MTALPVFVDAHIDADTPLKVHRLASSQWLRIGDPSTAAINLFADDTELARLRDVIQAHLDSQAGGES